MPAITAAENEQSILQFRRERLCDGIQVAHVAARRGENSLVHHHTCTRDTFYVMTGKLTVTLYLAPEQRPSDCYKTISARPALVSPTVAGQQAHRLVLTPGDVLVIEPGVVHCTANLDDTICRFLCIEGIGDYDFLQDDLRGV